MLKSGRPGSILLSELTVKAVMQQDKLVPALSAMQLEMQHFSLFINSAYLS